MVMIDIQSSTGSLSCFLCRRLQKVSSKQGYFYAAGFKSRFTNHTIHVSLFLSGCFNFSCRCGGEIISSILLFPPTEPSPNIIHAIIVCVKSALSWCRLYRCGHHSSVWMALARSRSMHAGIYLLTGSTPCVYSSPTPQNAV